MTLEVCGAALDFFLVRFLCVLKIFFDFFNSTNLIVNRNLIELSVSGILRYKVDFQSMQLEDGLYDDEDFDLDDY